MMLRGEGVRAMTLFRMNFEPSLSLCTSRTLHVVHELKKDDYIYKDPQNKYEQFVERLECSTCISATVFKSRYNYQLLLS